MGGSTFDVFLSYATRDIAAVAALREALKAAGLAVWWDSERIDSHAGIVESLEVGLASSVVVVACVSHVYPTRPACLWEASEVLGRTSDREISARILPLELEPGAVSRGWSVISDVKAPPAPQRSRAADPGAWLEVARGIAGYVESLTSRDVIGARRSASIPWFPNELSPRASFSGRFGQLLELHHLLGSTKPGMDVGITGFMPPVTVTGMPGVGKSLLVAEYARRFAGRWRGGVIRLDAGGEVLESAQGPDSVAQSLALIVGRLEALAAAWGLPLADIPADTGGDGLEGLRLRVTWLRHLLAPEIRRRAEHGGVLWWLDDLPATMTESDLSLLLSPLPDVSRTVITTRNASTGQPGFRVPLTSLDVEASLAVLNRHSLLQPTDEQYARQVIEVLGGHPLGVDVTGARMTLGAETWKQLARRLTRGGLQRFEEMALEYPQWPDHSPSLVATIDSSLQVLEARDPESVAVLNVCAVLAPGRSVSAQLIAAVVHWEQLGVGLDVEGDIFDDLSARTADAATSAVQLSLAAAESGTLRLHSAIADALRLTNRLSPGEEDRLRHVARRVFASLQASSQTNARQMLEYSLDHAVWIAVPDSDPTSATHAEYEDLPWGSLGRFAFERGRFQTALQLHSANVLWLTHNHPNDPRRILVARLEEARTSAAVGRFAESARLAREAAEMADACLGSFDALSLALWSQHSVCLLCQGDAREAVALDRRLVALADASLDRADPVSLRIWQNLAASYNSLGLTDGRVDLHALAEEIGRWLPDAWESVTGPRSPQTLTAQGDYALTLWHLGRHEEALPIEQQLARERLVRNGPEHPLTLICQMNVASSLRSVGRADAAVPLAREILTVACRVLGDDHPVALTAQGTLAGCLAASGLFPEALDHAREVLSSREARFGPAHRDVATARANLCLVQMAMNGYQVDWARWDDYALSLWSVV